MGRVDRRKASRMLVVLPGPFIEYNDEVLL